MTVGVRRRIYTIPGSHISVGTLDLPSNYLAVMCQYGVKNTGTAPGRVAIKMNITRKEFGGDATWFRYTPLADDDQTPESGLTKPGIITDKMFRDSHSRESAAGVTFRQPLIQPGVTIDLTQNPPGELIPYTSIVLPGGNNDWRRNWWYEHWRGRDFKIDVWLQWISEANLDLGMLDKHTFEDAFSFSDKFNTAPQLSVVGDPGLQVLVA